MTNDERITALAQDIYVARHNQKADLTGTDLSAFLDQTISWVNQLIPEIEKARDPQGRPVYWDFLRHNDAVVGTVTSGTTIAYPLPDGISKLVMTPGRDLTIRQDGTVVSTFRLVNPNQQADPNDYDVRPRATVLRRQIIFSRPLTDVEVGGDIVADTIDKMPRLSHDDVRLLDTLDDEYYDAVRQMFIFGVLKNQVLPDIVQGGLTPTFAKKFDDFMALCIVDNNASAEADDASRENLSWVGGVGF